MKRILLAVPVLVAVIAILVAAWSRHVHIKAVAAAPPGAAWHPTTDEKSDAAMANRETTPHPVKRHKLDFPEAELQSAEVRSYHAEGEWRPIELESAQLLVKSLAVNDPFFAPPNMDVSLIPPTWVIRFTWTDGTVMDVPVTHDAGCIECSEKWVKGVPEGMNYGTFIVSGRNHEKLVERCVGGMPAGSRIRCLLCGMDILSIRPYAKVEGASVFYFCSQWHLDEFERNPDAWRDDEGNSKAAWNRK